MRNFVCVIFMVSIPMLFCCYYNYVNFNNELERRMITTNEEILQKNSVIVDNIMLSVLEVLEELSKNEKIHQFIKDENIDIAQKESVEGLITVINDHSILNSYVKEIYVFSEARELVIDTKNIGPASDHISGKAWYELYKEFLMESPYLLVDGNKIYCCTQVYSETEQRAGVIALEVEIQKIRKILENENVIQKGIFFIRDISGQIVYCSLIDYHNFNDKEKREYMELLENCRIEETYITKDSNRIIMSAMESMHQSWNYALLTLESEYGEEVNQRQGYLYGVFVISLLSSVIATAVITYISYKPVKKIMDLFEGEQDNHAEGKDKRSNELLYITSNILKVINEGENINRVLEERIEEVKHEQVRALQFQMNPHFLYNTLDTIKWNSIELFGVGNPLEKALVKLSELYRISLTDEYVTHSLYDEMMFAKTYIMVLNIRFQEKIQYTWDIDESLYNSVVVKMIIQPLVENAVNHGLKKKKYYGNIFISAYQKNKELHLSVEDDGDVLTSGEIMVLNRKMENIEKKQETSIGLSNINRRIKLIYGMRYGVHISRSEKYEKGTKVEVVLPHITAKEAYGDV